MRELELPAGDTEVVARIVRAYRGPLLRIHRAFEVMRTCERFVRCQRDGDEIDIDDPAKLPLRIPGIHRALTT